MSGPVRVQRRRTRGWRTPLCGCGCGQPARYVGRPTFWGNDYVVDGNEVVWLNGSRSEFPTRGAAAAAAVAAYRADAEVFMRDDLPYAEQYRKRLAGLAGHDLVCWCPSWQQCHVDVLLELANGEAT